MRNRTDKASEIISFAKKFVGVPYKYGATMEEAPKCFDCSGFIKYIFEKFGYEIPRNAIQQAEFFKRTIKGVEKLKIGDLIYLHGTRGYYTDKFPKGIGHVVMYVGDGNVIHASGSGKRRVVIERLGGAIKKRKPLVVIKRIIK